MGVLTYRHFIKFLFRMTDDEDGQVKDRPDTLLIATQFGHSIMQSASYGVSNLSIDFRSTLDDEYHLSCLLHQYLSFSSNIKENCTPLLNSTMDTKKSSNTTNESSIEKLDDERNNLTLSVILTQCLRKVHGPKAKWRSENQFLCTRELIVGKRNIICCLPTGSGKGDIVVVGLLAEQSIRKKESSLTIYMVPTIGLEIQFLQRFEKVAIPVECWSSLIRKQQNQVLLNYHTKVVVITYQASTTLDFQTFLHSHVKSIKRIIFDEAHLLLQWSSFCFSFNDIPQNFISIMAPCIFFSATMKPALMEYVNVRFKKESIIFKSSCSRSNVCLEKVS
jgi:superfamily II DNA helicase RecQ